MLAITFGLGGSLHCAGMCSPLVMAVTRLTPRAILNKVLYNGGRLLTYGLLGAVAGLLGGILDLSAYQYLFSIILGGVFIIIGMMGLKAVKIPFLTGGVMRLTAWLKGVFGSLLKQRTHGTTFFLGALNGLLPCGLTYMALTLSLTAGGPVHGFVYMLLFGLGTVPAMLGVPWILQRMAGRLPFSISKVSTVMLLLVGILLVARNFVHQHPHESDGGAPHRTELSDPVLCR